MRGVGTDDRRIAKQTSLDKPIARILIQWEQKVHKRLLGGSWVVIHGLISRVTGLISHQGTYNPNYNYP